MKEFAPVLPDLKKPQTLQKKPQELNHISSLFVV